jgi:signal transduction histidine kinase
MRHVDPSEFMAGLVRHGGVRTRLERLAADLARGRAAWAVRKALGRALGDTSLELAFWIPHLDRYVDTDGRPIELPTEGRRETTVIEEAGVPVAALVCDASRGFDTELLTAVCAVAAPALERERGTYVARLRETETQALLDAMPDLMLRISREGVYLDFAGDIRLLAAPPEAMIGESVHRIVPADVAERLLGATRRALDTGALQTTEYRLRTLDDVVRDFEARFVPSGADEVLAVIRDISERKRTERELGRLQDELRASLERLRESRARIVEAGDTERRRLERNLHDGAQQRLVAVSHYLQIAQRQLDPDAEKARTLLESATSELAEAHAELRELAQGIHPASLTVGGLGSALRGLAERSTLRVTIAAVPDARLPETIEVAAYYVVSEALTNAAKHARASSVTVNVVREDGRAIVEVADDGVGGVDLNAGSGLVGLSDRVEALSGRLEVESPPGEGTRVRAIIPTANA